MHFAHWRSRIFGRSEIHERIGLIVFTTVHEVFCVATVKTFLRIGRKGESTHSVRGARELRATCNDAIQCLTVVCGDVFDVLNVFQAPFDLKGGNARVNQRFKVIRLIAVFEAQDVCIASEHLAFERGDIVGEAAKLCALSTVSTATCHGLRDIALSRVTYAKRTMNKGFDTRGFERCATASNFAEGKLTGEHHLRKAHRFQKGSFFRRTNIALR